MTDDKRFELSRRKALGAIGTIGGMSAAAGFGTTAFFSDRETFANNELVAGELDLKVDWQQTYDGPPAGADVYASAGKPYVNAFPDSNDDGVQDPISTRDEIANSNFGDDFAALTDSQRETVEASFREQFADVPDDVARPLIDLEDVKPGDSGEVTFSLHLFDNPGYIDMVGSLDENAENSLTEAEAETPHENGGEPGELLDEIQATLWYDEDGDNELDPGDSTLRRRRCGEAALGLFDIDEDGNVVDGTERTINLGIGADVEPWGLSFHDGGSRTFVTDMHKDSVIEVDADSDEIVDELHVNTAPRDTAVANGKLYVANTGTHAISDQGTTYDYTRPEGPGSITIYDLDTRDVVKTILLVFDDDAVDEATDTIEVTRSTGPRLLAKSDDESRVFVALGGANELAILDTDTDSVEATVETGGTDPRDMAVTEERVLVANFGSQSVSAIDVNATPPTLEDTVEVDQNPWSIIADTDSDPPLAAVANWSGGLKDGGSTGDLGSVVIIDLNSLTVLDTFTVDSTPDGGPWGISKCGSPPIIVTNDGTDRTLIIVGGNITIVQKGELPWDVECSEGGGDSLGSDRVGVPYGGADIDFREVGKERTVTDGTVEWAVTYTGNPQIEEVPHLPAVTPGDDGTYPVPEPVPVDDLRGIDRVVARGPLRNVLGRLRGSRGYPLDGDRLTVDRDPYPNSTTQHVALKWRLPSHVGNQVQTDSVTFDVGFETEQARRNDPDGQLATAPDEQLAIDVTETTGPRLMTKSNDGSRVFVALAGSGELLILDTATDSVEARVETGGSDPRDVAVVDDETVLVTNFGSGTVGEIDLGSSPPTVDTISVGENPWGIDTDGEIAVVPNWSGSDGNPGSISVLDLTTDPVDVTNHPIPSTDDGGPWGVATCPNRPVYITNDGTDSTLKIEFTDGSIDVEEVDEGELPWDAGCSPDGEKVAVAYGGADITFEEVGKRLRQRGREITCEEVEEGRIEWIVEKRGEVRTREFDAGGGDGDVGAQQVPGGITRTRFGEAGLAVLDSATGEVLQRVNLGLGDDVEPWGVTWSPDSSSVYVSDMHKNSVIEVDAATGKRLSEFHTNTAPRDAVVANGKLYVANTGSHAISEKGTAYDYTGPEGPGSISIYDLGAAEVIKSILVLPDDL